MAGAVVLDMDGTRTNSEAIWDDVRRGLAASEVLALADVTVESLDEISTDRVRSLIERL